MNNVEILAPAGAREQLEAAIRAGADAVYLGYGAFNARRNAKNFSPEELKDAINYAHVHGVKIHATVNTLVNDSELDQVVNDITELCDAGVDALIVQDLGVARIIKKIFPQMEMHASTQLTVHNLSGVRLLERLGFSRVVLARELSLEEIRSIAQSTSCEIEVFVHGALCMCVSGGCYLSSMLGQRSGNRGLCAQPCRLDFKTGNKDHALSLKDMCHIPYIKELASAGVTSFKIEGRMKRPEYVYASVSACRDALNGKAPDTELLKAVFSRSGFTDGYLKAKRNENMFGYRTKDDVVAAESVLKDLRQKYKNEVANVAIDVFAEISENVPVSLTVSDGVNTVFVSGAVPEQAQNRATSYDDVKKQLSKVGGTPYFINSIEISIGESLSVPFSELNELRRNALNELSAKRCAHSAPEALPFTFEKKAAQSENRIFIRLENASQALLLNENDSIILPISQLNSEILKRKNVFGEIPSIIFNEKPIKELLSEKKALGLTDVFCDNVGAIELARAVGLNVYAGWGMNALNSQTLCTLKELDVKGAVVSFETGISNFNSLSGEMPLGIIGYGYLPLMRMRACPLKAKDCGACKGFGTVTDRMNVNFLLKCHDRQFTTLYNSVPLYVGDKNINASFHVLYFTSESPQDVRRIYDLYKNGEKADFSRTTGLYFKQLL